MVGINSGENVGANALNVVARLKLTGELAGLTQRLTGHKEPPITRIKIAARMAAIVKQLGVETANVHSLADESGNVGNAYMHYQRAMYDAGYKSFGERQVWLTEGQAERILGLIKSYAKRAEKLGVEPISAKEMDSRMVQWWTRKGGQSRVAAPIGEAPDDKRYSIKTESVERQVLLLIKGDLPVLSGWRILGKIEHEKSGNILKQVTDTPIPDRYMASSSYCEHCNKVRGRLATYVLQGPDGEAKQVGSSCINDFLGHGDAEGIAALAEQLSNFWQQLEKEVFDDPDREGGGGGSRYYPLDNFLAYVVQAVRRFGWVSRATADEKGTESTAQTAFSALLDPSENKKRPSEDEVGEANAAIEFAKSITEDQAKGNSFLNNIRVIALDGAFSRKNYGFAAAIVQAYRRSIDEAKRKADEHAKPSQWQGTIGKRDVFNGLTVERVNSIEGHYGTTHIHNFRDEAGNVFVWFSSGEVLEKGRTYDLAATVKSHDEYKGVQQTVITRAKVQNVRYDHPEDFTLADELTALAESVDSVDDFLQQAAALISRKWNDANMVNALMLVNYSHWPIKDWEQFMGFVRNWYLAGRAKRN